MLFVIASLFILTGFICQIAGIYKNSTRLVLNGFVLQSLPFWVAVLVII